MMRRMAVVVAVALLTSARLFAAPGDVSLVKPSVACPQTQLGDAKLQSEYDGLWKAYGEKVAVATKATEEELNRLYEAAKSTGNLDLALFWNDKRKSLAETGRLRWEPTAQKKDWKRFGDTEFPEGLAAILSKSDAAYDKAKDALEAGYKMLETELTKADKLEQAVAIRNEFRGLWATSKPSPPPEPAKPPVVDLLKQVKLEDVKGWKRNAGIFAGFRCDALTAKPGITGDYDLIVEFRLKNVDDKDGVIGTEMTLPGVEGSPMVAIVGKGKAGVIYYFAGRKLPDRPPDTRETFSPGIAQQTWHEAIVRVRQKSKSVSILLDDKEILHASPFIGLPATDTATINRNTGSNEMMIRKWEIRAVH